MNRVGPITAGWGRAGLACILLGSSARTELLLYQTRPDLGIIVMVLDMAGPEKAGPCHSLLHNAVNGTKEREKSNFLCYFLIVMIR